MKKSKYNLIFEHDGKKLAFNYMSCALAEINDGVHNMLNSINTMDENDLDKNQKKLLNSMKDGGYVIENDIDEISLLKFKRYQEKFGKADASLTILPTLACNFECSYCYEEHKNIFISDDVKNAIYSQVERLAQKGNNISITWYGGEPLLAKKAIWEMSKKMINICDKYKVKYSAIIVTNGYLIDNETIEEMIKSSIVLVYTTLDGPPEVHNSMRKLKASNLGTFDIIVRNIKKLRSKGINVHIRINTNKVNEDKLDCLLDILACNELNNCSVDLGQLKAYTNNCSAIADSCVTTERFAKQSLKYQHILDKNNFFSNYSKYPSRTSSYCKKSHSLKSLIIGPKGELYSCWVEVGDKDFEIGNIWDILNEKEKINMHNINYFLWSPFNYQECIECQTLPICMGGCPHCARQDNKPDCQMWKYNIVDTLKMTYDKGKNRNHKVNDENFQYIVEPKY